MSACGEKATDARSTPQDRSGCRCAVACGHPAGAAAALRILESGGNVVDAALSASAVLTVVMPQATTIGGDAFVLVREANTETVYGLNASGCAPSNALPDRFAHGMHARGALAPVVPGLVKGWHELHQRFGSVQWRDLLADAISLADSGFVVDELLATSIGASLHELEVDEGCSRLFLPTGVPVDTGRILKQPALAATLQTIATEGASSFYEGAVGELLVSHIRRCGGLIEMRDLNAYTTSWVEPLASLHGDHRVFVMPPNSMGVLMLMQLKALSALPAAALTGSNEQRILWQIRAMRAAFETALAEIGDPESMRVSAGDLLAEGTSNAVMQRMLGKLPQPQPVPVGGTACITVADAKGNAACIVQSTFNPFGAHFLDPSTGILFNNRMSGFDHRPGHVNSITAGGRCAHTLNPVIVTRGNALSLVHASPGGVSQTITGMQILVNVIDRKLDLASAVADGRWAMDRRGGLLVEPTVSSAPMPALAHAGLTPRYVDDPYFYGSATTIAVAPNGELRAVADARRQCAADAL